MRRTAAVVLVTLLVLAACGDDGEDVGAGGGAGGADPGADVAGPEPEPAPTEPAAEPGASPPAGADDPLAGRTFTVLGATGHQLVADTTVTLAFSDGTVAVEAGCNRLSGTYSLDGATLVVEALGGTEMGCSPELMEQDAWLGGFLGGGPTVVVEGGEARALTDGEVTLDLTRPAPERPAELVGPTWALDTILGDGGADATAASVPAGVTATVTFGADGTYRVEAGCNGGGGTYAEAGAGIYQIDPPRLTRRRCAEEAMDVEAAVVAVLDGEVSASIEGTRLTLSRTGGGAGLGFATG